MTALLERPNARLGSVEPALMAIVHPVHEVSPRAVQAARRGEDGVAARRRPTNTSRLA